MHTAVVPERFAGKTAIVTGAGSGIGKAIAERILAEGGTVVASDVSEERLAAFAAEAQSDRLRTVVSDVTVEADVEKLVAAADGRVDAVANNAGIMDGFLPAAEIEDALWQRVFDINVTGVMRLTRAVLPGMLERGSGTIVNTASEAGIRGNAAGAAYTASKHAVVGFTKNTAFMYGRKGIRVNAVAPGGVATNVDGSFKSDYAAQLMGPAFQTLGFAPATPEQLASAITWLLSVDSSNVNGVVLASDGGWSAQRVPLPGMQEAPFRRRGLLCSRARRGT